MPDNLLLERAPSVHLPASDPVVPIAVTPPASRLVFRGNQTAAKAAGEAFGLPLPLKPCRAEQGSGRAALWLGPDEWLLLAEGADPQVEASKLEARLQAEPQSVVDVSHRQLGLCLHGSRAARLLSAGCPLDLDVSVYPPGMVARTIFAKAEIVLWRRDVDVFHVEVWRSYADYVTGMFAEAARGLPTF